MVRIDSTPSVGKTRAPQKARKSSKSRAANSAANSPNVSFAQSLSQAEATEAPDALETQASVSEIDGDIGLLALQEKHNYSLADNQRAKKRAIAYAEGLIDRLQALHVRLLSGVVSEQELLQLQGFFANDRNSRAAIDDQKLRSILSEIELRVQVEIAKKRR